MSGSDPAEMLEEPRSRGISPSLIWLVPLLVVAAAVALLYQNISTRGPEITVIFESASGLKAGDTAVRYRDVVVGTVEEVRFTESLERVEAVIRMERTVAPYLDDSAKFWVVRPQVSAQGITGIETVISGSYIEASWDTDPEGDLRDRFEALDAAPQTPEGTPGLRLTLRAEDGGSLEIGSPIFYKRVEVGKVEGKSLTADGAAVEFEIFVNAPNDQRITSATRFWNASGVDLELGADGARLRIASLASLLRGGASFDQVGGERGAPVEPGTVFPLFTSESDARENLISGATGEQVALQIFFEGSVRGLRAGAPVEYRGIRVGSVASVTAAVDPDQGVFRTRTVINISPGLLGLDEGDRDGTLDFLAKAVTAGLRAKVAMGSLLTGALYVNLEDAPNAVAATLDPGDEIPTLPSIPSDIEELAGSVEGMLDRVDRLPIEALLGNAVTLLDSLNQLASSDETRAIPGEALSVLAAAQALVSSTELQETTADAAASVKALRMLIEDPALQGTPEQVSALVASLAALVGDLEEAGTAGDLAATVTALRLLAEGDAVQALPDNVNQTLDAARTLLASPELTRLPEEINGALAELSALLANPETQSLPRELSQALTSLRLRLEDPGLVQATAELGPLIAETRGAVERLTNGIDPVLAEIDTLLANPELKRTPEALTAALNSVQSFLDRTDIQDLSAEAAATLTALRAILEEPGAKAVPEELAATLTSARSLLASLEREKAAENLSQTLESARRLIDDPALRSASRELSRTLEALRGVLAAPGVEALPETTRQALAEATRVLQTLRESDLVGSARDTLAGVGVASRSIARAADRLPGLIARLGEVSERADQLLASVGVGSELNYEAVAAIRDIRDAARAVTELADLVERKPNSIILGK